MSFSVTWHFDASEEFIELWSDPDIRQAVVEAAQSLDAVLRAKPLDAGESRSDNKRIYFESPLVVIYEVFLAERRVNILRVRYYAKR
jgi:hypothetical protein